jgi:DNA repair exonuclease SbcCD nuclease subunit
MKIALVGDLHLFSSLIGGNWEEDSFTQFEQKILPALEREKPDTIIFTGDLLVPGRGTGYPSWPRGDEASGKFVTALKSKLNWLDLEQDVFMLRGNHDFSEPLKNISEMGGPR